MSIFFDFEVGPSGRRFRRAVDGDKYDVEAIINHEHTEKVFGKPDIGRLMQVLKVKLSNSEINNFLLFVEK